MAAFISLKVVWNSPMKSCVPFESQSHTVHYNNKKDIKTLYVYDTAQYIKT